MGFSLIDKDAGAVPLTVLSKAQMPRWRESASARERDWAQAAGFTGEAGKIALVPDEKGKLGRVLVGGSDSERGDVGGRRPLRDLAGRGLPARPAARGRRPEQGRARLGARDLPLHPLPR